MVEPFEKSPVDFNGLFEYSWPVISLNICRQNSNYVKKPQLISFQMLISLGKDSEPLKLLTALRPRKSGARRNPANVSN